MSRDTLLDVIETIYQAGLDPERWSAAFAGVVKLVGGVGVTLEIVDRKSIAHKSFQSFNLPPPSSIAYLREFATMNPRIASAMKQRLGGVEWDYQTLDETGMDRHPFHTEFLAKIGLRYYTAGILQARAGEFASFTIQRSARHGHVARREIDIIRKFTPHVGRALEISRRIADAGSRARALEAAFDLLADGVALVRDDGHAVYVNSALETIVRAGDGVRLEQGEFVFSTAETRRHYAAALGAARLADDSAGAADFFAPRPSGAAAYVVSVRPLRLGAEAERMGVFRDHGPSAIVFVRDPTANGGSALRVLRDYFGFTPAEAALADAIESGTSVPDYARRRGISLNTAYTHLRHIKEKTGTHRMTQLLRKLAEVRNRSLQP